MYVSLDTHFMILKLIQVEQTIDQVSTFSFLSLFRISTIDNVLETKNLESVSLAIIL